MLGEDHSLTNEFPEYLDKISQLIAKDAVFAKDAKRYDALDEEIRQIEMSGAPIDDETMHQLKHNRVVLKDALYQCLVNSG